MKIIAEIGGVHDGSIGNAKKLIETAADSGADVVKFQTHIADAESLPDAPSPSYFTDESRVEYFNRTAFSVDQWQELADHARASQITFLSSPFSLEAMDLLEQVNVEAYKIPSGEVSNIPLLEKVAQTGKPTLLSSGMSNWQELDAAVSILRPAVPLTVLQCTSSYPCQPEQVGLNVITEMRERYGVPIGFSDHTHGYAATIAAAALGATVIEKHFTFSRLMYGSDAKNAMEPGEFKALVRALHDVWRMLENPVDKDDLSPYEDMKRVFEKSIVTTRALKIGTTLTMDTLALKKPGDGMPASQYRDVLGRKLVRAVPKNHQLKPEDLE